MAKHYGIPVVLHSDHCAKKLLEWFDGMLEADEAYFKEHKEPLFSRYVLYYRWFLPLYLAYFTMYHRSFLKHEILNGGLIKML